MPVLEAQAPLAEPRRATLDRAADALRLAGCDTPRLDAELLLAAALGVTRNGLYQLPAAPLSEVALKRFHALLARRAAREPVAYILGSKGFRRLSLAVDRRVLIPRPETELLVEVGLGLPVGSRVADVGTGCGAVSLALKDERSDLQLTGIDLSLDALAVARANASNLSLQVDFVHGDLLAGAPYDAVLANLPYVAVGEPLMPEISGYEPPAALYGGADGLDLVRRLATMLDRVSLVALEVGATQAGQVEGLLRDIGGFASVERWLDLAGSERVLVGRR